MTDNSQSVVTISTQSTPESKVGQYKKVKSQLFVPLLIDTECLRKPTSTCIIFFCQNGQAQQVVVELDAEATISKAIVSALAYFQKQKLMIDTNPTHYELYVAKKNGQPKLDYPSFEMNQSVSKTMNHQFSLVHTVFPDQPPNKKTLPKVSSFNDPSIKANPKRKYTDSPIRADLKTNYVNSLADLDDFKLKKKTLSKEIDPPVTNKKTNWFLSLIGCACSSSKNE